MRWLVGRLGFGEVGERGRHFAWDLRLYKIPVVGNCSVVIVVCRDHELISKIVWFTFRSDVKHKIYRFITSNIIPFHSDLSSHAITQAIIPSDPAAGVGYRKRPGKIYSNTLEVVYLTLRSHEGNRSDQSTRIDLTISMIVPMRVIDYRLVTTSVSINTSWLVSIS